MSIVGVKGKRTSKSPPRSARGYLLVWLFATIGGAFLSIGLTGLVDIMGGQSVSDVTTLGQGQLLPSAAVLAFAASLTLLWKPGPATPALRSALGAIAILVAFIAVALSVDLHVASGIADVLAQRQIVLPAGFKPTPEITARMSELLYISTFFTGAFCVLLSNSEVRGEHS